MSDRRPLLVVDGDNLAHRAYHSTPKTVRGVDNLPINAIVGFTNILLRVWQKEQPRAVFVAWDTLGVDTYRSKLWPPYQGGRVFDQEIRIQLELLPEFCLALGCGIAKVAGYEADDLIGSAVRQEVEAGGSCLVYTTDKDSYQLVSDQVTVLSPKRGSPDPERIGPVQVVEKFGVLPEQVPDFKALSGDSSDKIPGIKGIGPQAASRLLLEHGTLEQIVARWEDHESIAKAMLFKEIATIRSDHHVALPMTGSLNHNGAATALRAMGASNLADRLETLHTR